MAAKTKKDSKTTNSVHKKQEPRRTKKFGMVNYAAGDFFARVKNSCMAKKHTFEVRKTKYINQIANTLKKEGYLDEVKSVGEKLIIRVSYHKKEPIIIDIKLMSKPGVRIYMSVDELEKYKGPYNMIVSTNKGTMGAKEAIKKRLGGEVIARIL